MKWHRVGSHVLRIGSSDESCKMLSVSGRVLASQFLEKSIVRPDGLWRRTCFWEVLQLPRRYGCLLYWGYYEIASPRWGGAVRRFRSLHDLARHLLDQRQLQPLLDQLVQVLKTRP